MSKEKQRRIVRRYWQSFVKSWAEAGDISSGDYQAWSFGNTPEMADRLGNLVRRGIKTATASLAWAYEAGGESYPRIGGYSIILDAAGLPVCIVQITELAETPFNEVDEEHAYQEGEGDRSLNYWRQVHWDFFSEECKALGREPDKMMPVVCEKFKLVYP